MLPDMLELFHDKMYRIMENDLSFPEGKEKLWKCKSTGVLGASIIFKSSMAWGGGRLIPRSNSRITKQGHFPPSPTGEIHVSPSFSWGKRCSTLGNHIYAITSTCLRNVKVCSKTESQQHSSSLIGHWFPKEKPVHPEWSANRAMPRRPTPTFQTSPTRPTQNKGRDGLPREGRWAL